MGDIKFPNQPRTKTMRTYTEIEIRIHNVMSIFNQQKINPEYSVRHYAKFTKQMNVRKTHRSYDRAMKEISRIFVIMDNASDDA